MYKKLTKKCKKLIVKNTKSETLTLFFNVTTINLDDSCFLFIYLWKQFTCQIS